MAALRIESFSYNNSINAVSTGFNSTAIKTRKTQKSTVFTKSFCIYIIKPCRISYCFMKTTLFWTLHFSTFTKTTDTFKKNKRCHMALEGLNSVCAKLELASCKNNEMLRINVLKKFTSHALSICSTNDNIMKWGRFAKIRMKMLKKRLLCRPPSSCNTQSF